MTLNKLIFKRKWPLHRLIMIYLSNHGDRLRVEKKLASNVRVVRRYLAVAYLHTEKNY